MINECLIPGKEAIINGGDRPQENTTNYNHTSNEITSTADPITADNHNTINETCKQPNTATKDNTVQQQVSPAQEDVLDSS
jgi:hypothetical protein